jgi:hypothetical protein
MVLDFIKSSIRERGYPPTLREIGAFMGIKSTNGVNDHLRALERKGYLKREDMKSRALRPTSSTKTDTIEVNVLGKVAAGFPVFAEENIEETFQFDPSLLGGHGETFVLRVQGDSMIDAVSTRTTTSSSENRWSPSGGRSWSCSWAKKRRSSSTSPRRTMFGSNPPTGTLRPSSYVVRISTPPKSWVW